jgi:hypothetical protein
MDRISSHIWINPVTRIVHITFIILLAAMLSTCASAATTEAPQDLPSAESGGAVKAVGEAEALDPPLLPEFISDPKGQGLQREIDLHTIIPDRPRMQIVTYLVQRGDTLFGIADKFGIKPESVLWGNWETMEGDPHTIQPGQELNIPPVDGVLYAWQEGDSLYKVAEFFRTTPEEILD